MTVHTHCSQQPKPVPARRPSPDGYRAPQHQAGNAGDIFALKQFGWRDKTEVEQHTTTFDVVGYVKAVEERNAKRRA